MYPIFFDEALASHHSKFIFSESESKHIVKVLRLSVNDKLHIINGAGVFATAKIIDNHPKRCAVEIISIIENYNPLPYYLHVAIAPTKNIDRIEWFIEKATEIGISEITPIICDNSERKIVKTERLKKVAIAAMKQSQKAFLPKINEAVKFQKWLTPAQNGFIAHCVENKEKQQFAIELSEQTTKNVTILIGPEGDFSQNEINLALKNNFKPVALGNYRLRTETAAIYAVNATAIHFLNQ